MTKPTLDDRRVDGIGHHVDGGCMWDSSGIRRFRSSDHLSSSRRQSSETPRLCERHSMPGPLISFVRKYSVYRELTIKTGHMDAAVRDGWGCDPGEIVYGIAWLHVAVPKLVFRSKASKASKAWSVAG